VPPVSLTLSYHNDTERDEYLEVLARHGIPHRVDEPAHIIVFDGPLPRPVMTELFARVKAHLRGVPPPGTAARTLAPPGNGE
jgi:hypothetical protein